MNNTEAVKNDLQQYIDPEKAEFLPKFFQALPGGYGEGDKFIGVRVPDQRKVAKKHYKNLTLQEVEDLLQEPVHEYRLTALFILVYKFEKPKTDVERKEIVDLYLRNTAYVNNWDLVDASAPKILGPYLLDKNKAVLYELAASDNLWRQRIAVIATQHFIKHGHFTDTLELAEILLHHEHDLIHKAVGWMLREVGNRDFSVEFDFLKEHYNEMPRTMLRYAIEKFEPGLRQQFLKGTI